MKHTRLLAAVLAVAFTGCFSDPGSTSNSTDNDSESDGSDGSDGSSGPDDSGMSETSDDSGMETDSMGSDGGTSSDGSTDDTGTDDGTSGETDGMETDGGTDTGEEPTVLEEGDLCHPLGANTLPCDPDQDLVCLYDGYDNADDQYEWICKEYSGLPNEGEYGDECFDFNEHTDCGDGHKCEDASLFPAGVCDNDENFCCTPHCNPNLGGVDCPSNTYCEVIHPNADLYPPIIKDSVVTTIGTCRG